MSVVVIQARTSSSRLPCKVLLPLSGFPVVVLAAKRAGNTGKEVIVATSDEPSDDGLAQILVEHEINLYRGSLINPLSRIVNALTSYDDSTIVFRLTADNVLPDGLLLDEIEFEFIHRNLNYLSCNGLNSGLPYGMSAEVTRLYYLREAELNAVNAYDLEHVMPYISRKFGITYFQKYKNSGMGNLRSTIDCLDDYVNLQRLFLNVMDPVNINAHELAAKLKGLPLQPIAKKPVPRLVLGTSQLGMEYGIANTSGVPTLDQAKDIIKVAISNGVEYVDTARAYLNSEKVIGNTLADGWSGRVKIVTKLSPLSDCPLYASPRIVSEFVNASLFESMSSLGLRKIDTLLLHRASHIDDWNGCVFRKLIEYREAGLIGTLGVSVRSPSELLSILMNNDIGHIQLPFNVLDWRWENSINQLINVRRKRSLIVHVRSVFLQGLLLTNRYELWLRAHVEKPKFVSNWINECCLKYNRSSLADFCISFVNAQPWIDGVLVGVETIEQLRENIEIFNQEPLSLNAVKEIINQRPFISEKSLDPSNWII